MQFVESVHPFQVTNPKVDETYYDSAISWTPPAIKIPTPGIHNSSLVSSHTDNVHMTTSSDHRSLALTTHPMTSSPSSSIPVNQPTSITQPPPPTHTMTTRSKNNITKPVQNLNLTAQLTPITNSEPTTVKQALFDPKWRKAMSEEFDALVSNGTWELVPSSPHQNIIGSKWIF